MYLSDVVGTGRSYPDGNSCRSGLARRCKVPAKPYVCVFRMESPPYLINYQPRVALLQKGKTYPYILKNARRIASEHGLVVYSVWNVL